jgi:hypothetical protein
MADEKVEQVAVTGVGAGVGTAGGATVGVLELAATQGTVTGLSAGMVIGAGAVVGALTFFLGYKAFRHLTKAKTEATAPGPSGSETAGQ